MDAAVHCLWLPFHTTSFQIVQVLLTRLDVPKALEFSEQSDFTERPEGP